MPFNSFNFWLVFPIIFAFYWIIPFRFQQVRKLWLILVSYLLYINWKPSFALVLLYVTIITYLGALAFDLFKSNKKRVLILFTAATLAPLLAFKYYNFLNESITAGLDNIGLHFAIPGLNWAIPVGLSFFTFQAAGYMFDVYRNQTSVEKNIIDYILFVSFFPQIASGPISKAEDLLPQIKKTHKFNYDQAKQGLKWLLWGMFIKLVLADRIGLWVDTVYANFMNFNGTTCFVSSILYSIQIYGDFAGYSLMAIGIAALLGFDLINNFRRPYLAVSLTDFWRRWHISLTRWLTQNIYIPLGGSKCSEVRCYFNILITFLVSGLWHGAAWSFIFWGAIHGIVQIIEKSLRLNKYAGSNTIVYCFRIFLTFLIVNFAWIFFRSPDITTAFLYIKRIFTNYGIPDIADIGGAGSLIILISLLILIFKDVRAEFFPSKMQFIEKKPVRWVIYVSLFCMIILFGILDGGQFIYVNF